MISVMALKKFGLCNLPLSDWGLVACLKWKVFMLYMYVCPLFSVWIDREYSVINKPADTRSFTKENICKVISIKC